MTPMVLAACRDELEKIAKSKLRDMVSIIPEVVEGGRAAGLGEQMRWKMMLDNAPVGFMETKGRQVSLSHLDPKYRGMGLGRKMYGEVMRRMPEAKMESDSTLSDAGKRVWESMGRRGSAKVSKPLNIGYRVPGTFGAEPTTYNIGMLGPHYQARLPPAAAIDTGKKLLPTMGERAKRLGRGVAGGAALAGMAALYTSPYWAPSVASHFSKKHEAKKSKKSKKKKEPAPSS